MRKCKHAKKMEKSEEQARQFASIIKEYESTKNILCCSICNIFVNLYICYTCGLVRCLEDWRQNTENPNDPHNILYELSTGLFYCQACDANVKFNIQNNESSKETETFEYYALKNFPNFGGTTHLNSVLQVMLNCKLFRNFFYSFHHSLKNCKKSNCPDCFFKSIYSQLYNPFSIDISNHVYNIAQESTSFLSLANSSLLKFYSLLCDMYHKDKPTTDCKCIMHDVFYGRKLISTTCTRCKAVVSYYEEFNSLVLKCNKSLDSALKRFFGPYLAIQKSKCSQCMENYLIYKSIEIKTGPNVLAIFFNRIIAGPVKKKNNCKIDTDLIIKIGEYIYEIYGFIDHRGIHKCSCILYLLLNKVWYEFADEKITKDLDVSSILPKATAVFYVKKTN